MPTIRELLTEHWESISDIIVQNAAPEKRETTMRTMKCYNIDTVVPLISMYARKYKSEAALAETADMDTISKLVAMFGIADTSRVQAEILPHIEAMVQLLG